MKKITEKEFYDKISLRLERKITKNSIVEDKWCGCLSTLDSILNYLFEIRKCNFDCHARDTFKHIYDKFM